MDADQLHCEIVDLWNNFTFNVTNGHTENQDYPSKFGKTFYDNKDAKVKTKNLDTSMLDTTQSQTLD